MRIALYPGSFDPITYGHLDIIKRASELFDKVIIAIMLNPEKKNTFTAEERKQMILESIKDVTGDIEVVIGTGLTVSFAESLGAKFLVRGIRAVMDYEYELQIATTNMALKPGIETVFFLTRPNNSFLSSTTVKMIAQHGGDLSRFIPAEIDEFVRSKFKKGENNE